MSDKFKLMTEPMCEQDELNIKCLVVVDDMIDEICEVYDPSENANHEERRPGSIRLSFVTSLMINAILRGAQKGEEVFVAKRIGTLVADCIERVMKDTKENDKEDVDG